MRKKSRIKAGILGQFINFWDDNRVIYWLSKDKNICKLPCDTLRRKPLQKDNEKNLCVW